MDLIVLGIVWRLDLHCRRASGHVALGSDVDHACMPTGMRVLSLPQASTEVCMSLPRNNVRCRRASGHVALGSDVDHSCMPTGMRELSLPQASTEVRMLGGACSAQPFECYSPVTCLSSNLSSEDCSYSSLEVHSNTFRPECSCHAFLTKSFGECTGGGLSRPRHRHTFEFYRRHTFC